MPPKRHLGEFEQMVLLAVLNLREKAYGPEIIQLLADIAGRRVSWGALYATMERLEEKGLVRWRIETPDDRGRPRRHFAVTAAGVNALRRARRVLVTLWDDVEDVLGGVEA